VPHLIGGDTLSDKPGQDNGPDAVQPADNMPRMISSRDLLAGQKRVIIRHEQEDYRLQVTATGKLILTK
jgi:hemin uptake protein HemP